MRPEKEKPGTCILLADDDPDDQYMIREALSVSGLMHEIRMVSNGEELLDYLNKKGKFKDEYLLYPVVVLLDLSMPKKDGWECLMEIKADPKLRKIPIVILSTSNNPDDIVRSYERGAASYITKPYSYKELVEVMETFKKYWLHTVRIPPC